MEPREGLPPCVKGLAISDERAALWTLPCSHAEHWKSGVTPVKPRTEHLVRQGIRRGKQPWHGLPVGLLQGDVQVVYAGDDPDEAAAAFERGREYVLMGQLGEAT